MKPSNRCANWTWFSSCVMASKGRNESCNVIFMKWIMIPLSKLTQSWVGNTDCYCTHQKNTPEVCCLILWQNNMFNFWKDREWQCEDHPAEKMKKDCHQKLRKCHESRFAEMINWKPACPRKKDGQRVMGKVSKKEKHEGKIYLTAFLDFCGSLTLSPSCHDAGVCPGGPKP